MRRLDPARLQDIRDRHIRRFGDPMYAEHDDIGALIDEVESSWAELRRIRADNEYLRGHVSGVVGWLQRARGD